MIKRIINVWQALILLILDFGVCQLRNDYYKYYFEHCLDELTRDSTCRCPDYTAPSQDDPDSCKFPNCVPP